MKPTGSVDVALLLPDLGGGGAERVAVNLANDFVRRGLKVQCVLMEAKGVLLDQLAPEVEVVDLRAPRMRSCLLPLIGYLRRVRPEALIAFMWPLTMMAVVARILARSPTKVIVTEHTTLSISEEATKRTPAWLLFLTVRLSYPLAHAVVAVSQGSADDMVEHAGLASGSVKVIHNPIIADLPMSARTEAPPGAMAWAAGSGRIIAIGTMKPQKRFDKLLEAFCLLRAARPAQLLMLGEGPQRAALERRAVELGVAHAVTMPGFVLEPMVYLRHADLFVLASAWEGFGNVIVEAMAEGVPVVSTDCPSGPSEILERGAYGRLVPVDDAQAMADAMRATLAEVPDRARLKARAAHFSVARAADAYLELLSLGAVR